MVIDIAAVPVKRGSGYPPEFQGPVATREKQALGDAAGLKNFGVNLVRVPPGTDSTQRHWHSRQDEFVYVLEGELTLVTDAGAQVLTAGMCAGFPANSGDGHVLRNLSDTDAVYLEVGDRTPGDEVDYPDVDMQVKEVDGVRRPLHRDGTPY
ncbi:MAG TPA: cupin domain-containing protein [Alphaproteobacteria bacterium]|nr:cupin domain-containing protein [Alphaproteobacteria bacterium]